MPRRFGSEAAVRAVIVRSSVSACAIEAPGFRRPMANHCVESRPQESAMLATGKIRSGASEKYDASDRGNWKEAGSTPMTLADDPSIVRERPATWGSLWKA